MIQIVRYTVLGGYSLNCLRTISSCVSNLCYANLSYANQGHANHSCKSKLSPGQRLWSLHDGLLLCGARLQHSLAGFSDFWTMSMKIPQWGPCSTVWSFILLQPSSSSYIGLSIPQLSQTVSVLAVLSMFISYFSVATIKYLDKNMLGKKGFYFIGSKFQRVVYHSMV